METILHRSSEYAKDKPKRWGIENTAIIAAAYEDGATEQREIVIKRACEWMRENIEYYANDFTRELNYDALCADFSKAMKGE